jgi:hypothetical protein
MKDFLVSSMFVRLLKFHLIHQEHGSGAVIDEPSSQNVSTGPVNYARFGNPILLQTH